MSTLSFFDPFGVMDMMDNHPFFNRPSFTRKVTVDSHILADKTNYKIFELPNGKHEVRVQVSNDHSSYYRSVTVSTLEEAKKHVDEQTAFHKKKVAGPQLVWDYSEDGTKE